MNWKEKFLQYAFIISIALLSSSVALSYIDHDYVKAILFLLLIIAMIIVDVSSKILEYMHNTIIIGTFIIDRTKEEKKD